MVHRPTDARLLTNLISQDKDLSKQFYTFLDVASASVSSLSAYAAASAPPASHIILKVSGSLASADDALRRYAASIDEWREQLKALKTLEDEVTNIIRDREILVTRVLKASKHKQSTGNLQRARQFPSSSSLSTTTKSEFSPGVAGLSKLSHSQSELQACETHLAEKERELSIRRCVIIKSGLDARFRTMVECGWAWGEIGKEALGVLEQLSSLADEQSKRPSLALISSGTNVPPSGPSSDLSLSPSQSASQINLPHPLSVPRSILSTFHPSASEPVSVGQSPRSDSPGFHGRQSENALHTLNIPPAHAIADMDMHVAVLLPSPPPSNGSHDVTPSSASIKSVSALQNGHALPRSYATEERPYEMRKHVLSRRITEEELDQTRAFSSRRENESSSEDGHNDLTAVDNPRFVKGKKSRQYHTEKLPSKRDRRRSLFGSLRGLFGHHRKDGSADEGQPTRRSSSSFFGGKKNKWDMRTERNLREMDMEDEKQIRSVARLNSPPRSPGSAARLRRASDEVGSRGSLRFVNGNMVMDKDTTIGESDNESRRRKLTRGRGRGTGPLTRKRSSSMPSVVAPARNVEELRPVSVPVPPVQTNVRPPPPAGLLSRNSSIASAATAPVMSKMAGKRSAASRPQVERRASLGDKSMSKGKDGNGTERVTGHVRSASNSGSLGDGRKGILHLNPTNGATGSASLMSIVEDVARANRDAAEKLKEKKSLSMANLLPDQHVSSENAISPGSSTLTLRAGLGNSHVPSSSGTSEPGIYIPKAPHSLGRKELESCMLGTPLRGSAQMDGEVGSVTVSSTVSPASTPEKQRQGRTSTDVPNAGSSPSRRPAQSPLRSALRNSNSRSASPAPMAGPSHVAVHPATEVPASAPLPTLLASNDQAGKKGHDTDDAASVSSYETGREVPLEDPVAVPESEPMAKDSETNAETSPPPESIPSSNGTLHKRKSVRVSLQPTFSPSPVIGYDDDDEQERNGITPPKARWSAKQIDIEHRAKADGWSSRKRSGDIPRDFWENSSDEDEEYANAKRLLSRVSSTVSRPLKG